MAFAAFNTSGTLICPVPKATSFLVSVPPVRSLTMPLRISFRCISFQRSLFVKQFGRVAAAMERPKHVHFEGYILWIGIFNNVVE